MEKADRFAEEWASGKASTRREFEEMLKKAGLERVDRMLASAEARRNDALREIDRHCSTLGVAVRRAVDEVENAEFRDVETGEVCGGPSP
jgi:hypothetical protein